MFKLNAIGQGGLPMRKTSTSFADQIVSQYVKYNAMLGGYEVDYNSVDEIDILELAGLFMADDGRDAYSCISDNDQLDSDIVPAIMASLYRPGDSPTTWDLAQTIQKCVSNYYRKRTEELLADRLAVWEAERGYFIKPAWNPGTETMYEVSA